MSSGHRVEESLQNQLSEKRQQIVNLEHQIGRYRDEIATLKGHLTTSEEASASYIIIVANLAPVWSHDCHVIQHAIVDITHTLSLSLSLSLALTIRTASDCWTVWVTSRNTMMDFNASTRRRKLSWPPREPTSTTERSFVSSCRTTVRE